MVMGGYVTSTIVVSQRAERLTGRSIHKNVDTAVKVAAVHCKRVR